MLGKFLLNIRKIRPQKTGSQIQKNPFCNYDLREGPETPTEWKSMSVTDQLMNQPTLQGVLSY